MKYIILALFILQGAFALPVSDVELSQIEEAEPLALPKIEEPEENPIAVPQVEQPVYEILIEPVEKEKLEKTEETDEEAEAAFFRRTGYSMNNYMNPMMSYMGQYPTYGRSMSPFIGQYGNQMNQMAYGGMSNGYGYDPYNMYPGIVNYDPMHQMGPQMGGGMYPGMGMGNQMYPGGVGMNPMGGMGQMGGMNGMYPGMDPMMGMGQMGGGMMGMNGMGPMGGMGGMDPMMGMGQMGGGMMGMGQMGGGMMGMNGMGPMGGMGGMDPMMGMNGMGPMGPMGGMDPMGGMMGMNGMNDMMGMGYNKDHLPQPEHPDQELSFELRNEDFPTDYTLPCSDHCACDQVCRFNQFCQCRCPPKCTAESS